MVYLNKIEQVMSNGTFLCTLSCVCSPVVLLLEQSKNLIPFEVTAGGVFTVLFVILF